MKALSRIVLMAAAGLAFLPMAQANPGWNGPKAAETAHLVQWPASELHKYSVTLELSPKPKQRGRQERAIENLNTLRHQAVDFDNLLRECNRTPYESYRQFRDLVRAYVDVIETIEVLPLNEEASKHYYNLVRWMKELGEFYNEDVPSPRPLN